jgi:hypothetical protein
MISVVTAVLRTAHVVHLQENLIPGKIAAARDEGIQVALRRRTDGAEDPPPNLLLKSFYARLP